MSKVDFSDLTGSKGPRAPGLIAPMIVPAFSDISKSANDVGRSISYTAMELES